MINLHKSEYHQLDFDNDKKMMIGVWTEKTEDMSVDELKSEILKICDHIIETKPKYFLADDRLRKNLFTVQDQEWIAQTFGKAFVQAGLNRVAVMPPEEMVAQLSTEQTADELKQKKLPVDIKFCTDKEKALGWLFE